MNIIEEIKKSVLSGIMIMVGGSVYLASRTISVGSFNLMWLGALLFTAGLFTICVYGFNLYTGKVGYIALHFKDTKYIALVVLICVFNLLTTFLLGIVVAYAFPNIGAEAFRVYTPKLNLPLLRIFISGTFCGLLMFLAVDTWKKGFPIGCFLFVPVFIFSGFDHSIANSLYNGASFGHILFADDSFLNPNSASFSVFSAKNALLTLITVLGNGFGGMIIPLLTRKWKNAE